MSMLEPDTNNTVRPSSDLSAVVIPLLKGILYRDENHALWSLLVQLQIEVRRHVSVLGLELMIDDAEGYAYLHSRKDTDEDEAASVPRLIARRQLSYPVSLLLALLRKKLAEHDALGDDTRLILSLEDVVELVRIFLPADGNEAKMMDKVDASLTKIGELGFIRRLRGQNQMIEVRRIIKAFVDAQWLAEFDERLAEYRRQYEKPQEYSDD